MRIVCQQVIFSQQRIFMKYHAFFIFEKAAQFEIVISGALWVKWFIVLEYHQQPQHTKYIEHQVSIIHNIPYTLNIK